MSGILELLNAFTNLSTLLASIGMILATTSFISGLQMVKGKGPVEKKIHRGNGIITFGIFAVLAVMSFVSYGFSLLSLGGWAAGFFIILSKVLIVRSKSRRANKYVSWLGASLICMWLYIVYIHIPL
ncbi:MAG TPA: hypothetical protein DDW94_01600 [Deltaproteobacteria bacterium]|nr:MAG: hypothetical protein A2Z79_07790 [Deltaproteobacteria bacterium GWA2_55_82]OGQ65130.1 MAG: hypothetical protein A3I81_07210 [Deltaproteobacteria bacterium RIFCSPLOWO2_02_FULL_55_12]OIJ74743.1 MAG: hypothetical protein A2V21_310995 [Deltaproteobacteria bacterium GWC2_55_46]HBG45668.1 hypothetical protein [Deltaproteobacteria bacterium]HCY12139.1 hypothetical protein [Deltaproteobacteria bacterium]